MSDNEQKPHQNEAKMQNLFAAVNKLEMSPSPYLKTRVLAHVNEAQNVKKTLLFWKFLSAGSMAALVLVGVYVFNFIQTSQKQPDANQSYVIHVNFDQDDLTKVAKAEVVLPDDVYFKSSKGKIYQQRNLKLPIQVKNAGRGKLPFVVASAVAGEKNIQIRLLDENDQLIREQSIKFNFAKSGQQVSYE